MKRINKRGLYWLICDRLVIHLMILTGIPAMAQSFPNKGLVAESIRFSAFTLENKFISIGKNADNEINYKIVAAPSKEEDCPQKDKIEDLCSSIFNRKEDNDPESPYVYQYQRIITEAACVNQKKDSKSEKTNKINAMWKRLEDKLICDNTSFKVKDGNILKLAVASRLVSVLEDAIAWNVNLNRIDPSDKLTVLDYIKEELQTYKGTANGLELQSYYDALRFAGAKHANELQK